MLGTVRAIRTRDFVPSVSGFGQQPCVTADQLCSRACVNVYVCIAKVGACAYESLCVSVVCAPVNLTVAHITVANL